MKDLFFPASLTAKTAFDLSLNNLRWMLSALALAVLPHVLHMPIWVTLFFALLLAWRYASAYYQWQLPNQWLRLGLAVILLIGVVLSYRSLTIGRDAGVALLVGLLGLKLLEMRSLRDAMLLTFLSYFLIMTNFFYSQAMLTAVYLMLVMLVSTGALIALSDLNHALDFHKRARLSAQILLQSVPLAIVLFLLFPRVPGPLWGLPEDAYGDAQSGFSDTMQPGSISNLSLSDEVAFRVEFFSDIPQAKNRYWRGVVLWHTDGKTWKPGLDAPLADNTLQEPQQAVDYAITLEPHSKTWLFALDVPAAAPSDVASYLAPQLLNGHQIKTAHKVSQRLKYHLRSYTDYRIAAQRDTALEQQMRHALRLPANQHPRAKALALEWQNDNPQPQAIVQQALDYFNREAFFYTLAPPPLLNDPIDEFLFDSRRGFCEHYAATFVTLMRAASVPARVVVGYQGGGMNPLGNFMTVRQRDAHAWAEVWLQDQGWVRVDPTAAVAPERVQQGLNGMMPELNNPLGFQLEQSSLVMRSWRYLRNSLDVMNNSWNQWVLSYGQAQQYHLLQWLGLERFGYQALVFALLLMIGIILLFVGLWLFSVRRLQQTDSLQAAYLRFCRRLAKLGVERKAYEGPQAFAQRASLALPQQAAQIRQISQFYVQWRYRQRAEKAQQQHFKQLVKRFKI